MKHVHCLAQKAEEDYLKAWKFHLIKLLASNQKRYCDLSECYMSGAKVQAWLFSLCVPCLCVLPMQLSKNTLMKS